MPKNDSLDILDHIAIPFYCECGCKFYKPWMKIDLHGYSECPRCMRKYPTPDFEFNFEHIDKLISAYIDDIEHKRSLNSARAILADIKKLT